MVGFETEALVRFDRVEPGILQFISLKLRHQPDATAFLLLINHNARAFFTDHGQRKLKLLTAIAAQRMENVSCQALRVNSHQRRRGFDVAHDYCNGFLRGLSIRGFCSKAVDAELAPTGGEIRRGDLLDWVFAHTPIIAAGVLAGAARLIRAESENNGHIGHTEETEVLETFLRC